MKIPVDASGHPAPSYLIVPGTRKPPADRIDEVMRPSDNRPLDLAVDWPDFDQAAWRKSYDNAHWKDVKCRGCGSVLLRQNLNVTKDWGHDVTCSDCDRKERLFSDRPFVDKRQETRAQAAQRRERSSENRRRRAQRQTGIAQAAFRSRGF